jgi:hypothetical protein
VLQSFCHNQPTDTNVDYDEAVVEEVEDEADNEDTAAAVAAF